MINKLSLLSLFVMLAMSAFAQQYDQYNSPLITDQMTVNPDKNKKWRKGLYKYSAKPKTAWELGLHSGHYMINGDVDSRLPGGFGVGLHLRKSLHYIFSVRFDLFYGQAYGVESQVWEPKTSGGGLVESTFDKYDFTAGWYPKVKTQYAYASVETLINIGNVLFHAEKNKWNWFMILGLGLDTHVAMLNLFDENDHSYDVSGILDENYNYNERSGRIMIKKAVDNLYDDTYETQGFQKEGVFRIADKYNIHPVFIGGMGISRKINRRFNISLEYQFMASDNDYLDGILYRTSIDQTTNIDVGHYGNLRLAINIGNLDKKSEPHYWINPLDATFSDIADLKQRPVWDLTDTDGDGVVDMMDMEPTSPVGAKVDTRGVTLDSDGDGIADYKDVEPFSPPGYETDKTGRAAITFDEYVTKDEVRNMIDSATITDLSQSKIVEGIADWFLPMIHFDLDKYKVKPEFYGQLKHVADVMKKYPDLCVTAQGHTDSRNSNAYNEALSYKRANAAIDYLVDNYGIDRTRFNLMYGGEENPLTPNLPDHHNISREDELKQYMNRRVEFRTCQDTDFDMPMPEMKPSVGSNSYGSSRPGSKYSGNKNSGY